jgi:septal ring factor EnvC (AmiA/AmiB activator)
VVELEQAKADAAAQEDGGALDRIKDELADAREAAAMARANVAALEAVIADVEQQKAEDSRVAQEQQRREAARERYAVAQRVEQGAWRSWTPSSPRCSPAWRRSSGPTGMLCNSRTRSGGRGRR